MTAHSEPAPHYACDGPDCHRIAVTLPASWTVEARQVGPTRGREHHFCPACTEKRERHDR